MRSRPTRPAGRRRWCGDKILRPPSRTRRCEVANRCSIFVLRDRRVWWENCSFPASRRSARGATTTAMKATSDNARFRTRQDGYDGRDYWENDNMRSTFSPRDSIKLPSVPTFGLGQHPLIQYLRRGGRTPQRPPLVTIGPITYWAAESDSATVLVPYQEVRPTPPTDDAATKAAIMTGYPFGAGAYGIAKLLGANEGAGDAAFVGGAIIDTVLGFGGARRSAPPSATAVGGLAPLAYERPAIRHSQPTASGQATGTRATLTRPMLRTGTRASSSITPPGWKGDGRKHNQARGHLTANGVGGSGRKDWNLMTIPQNPTNVPDMQRFEREIMARLARGEVIEYHVTPLYDGAASPPTHVVMTATGTQEAPTGVVIQVPRTKPQ